MSYLPHFPLHLGAFILFGIVILLGLFGGEVVKRFQFIPSICGYILIGYVVGPERLGLISQSLLNDLQIFVDLSLGIILFNLGRHVSFSWLRHDPGLLLTSLLESGLSLFFTSALFLYLGLPWLLAIFAGIIAIVTSPAVVMLVAHDSSANGPVTRRTLILTGLNNFIALILFNIITPFTQAAPHTATETFTHVLYRLFGSVSLGLAMFIAIKALSYLTKKNKENQMMLFTAAIIITIGLASQFHFSIMLSLFILGVFARNLDWDNTLMEIDFGWLMRLLIIVLFVVIGINLHLSGLLLSPLAVIAFIIIRSAAKFIGVWTTASYSDLTKTQAYAISLALIPMADVAFGMSSTLSKFNPVLGNQLALIISTAVALLTLLGPIATQFAFIRAGETAVNKPRGTL